MNPLGPRVHEERYKHSKAKGKISGYARGGSLGLRIGFPPPPPCGLSELPDIALANKLQPKKKTKRYINTFAENFNEKEADVDEKQVVETGAPKHKPSKRQRVAVVYHFLLIASFAQKEAQTSIPAITWGSW